ncbi:MAG: tRNA adenosine(34) deaminase TadA [Acidobacteriaceae bacterium]
MQNRSAEQAQQDQIWMRHALALARAASAAAEVPVGAIIVFDGKVIAEAANRTIALHDPTAHAEILALRGAALYLQNYRLTGCELFSTLEPCAMCAGALLHARISRLVFAAPDPKAGAAGSVLSILNHPQLNHQMQVESGLCAAESSALLQEFFRGKRERG